jgi:hypothetical protein
MADIFTHTCGVIFSSFFQNQNVFVTNEMMVISGLECGGQYDGKSTYAIINDAKTKNRYPFTAEIDEPVGRFGGFVFTLLCTTLLAYIGVGLGTLVVLKADVDAVCEHIHDNILTRGKHVLDLAKRLDLAGQIWTLVEKYVAVWDRHAHSLGSRIGEELRYNVADEFPHKRWSSDLAGEAKKLVGVAQELLKRVVAKAPEQISVPVSVSLRDSIAQRLHDALESHNGATTYYDDDEYTADVLADTLLFIQKELSGDGNGVTGYQTIRFNDYPGHSSAPVVVP